ncbi:MAG: hypothetical protein ACJ75J_10495 [Cytophagaceae bacterium]
MTFILSMKVMVYSQSHDLIDSLNKDTPETGKVEESWGSIDPGKGFLLAKTKMGSVSVSAYVLTRYINQLPAHQTFTDHLGRIQTIDPRNDIQLHRILLSFLGFVYKPKLNYNVTVWTVNSTQQVAIVGNLSYNFCKSFNLFAGITGNSGTRSMNGSHPYWLAPDRVMADEFFRPGFTSGIWATGELFPKLAYKAMLGNNISQLGINAVQLTRHLTPSASVWWMPTTGEFGPRGAYGDFETHDKLATRFGTSWTHSRDNRFNDQSERSPDNTQIRISDGLLFFQTGSLAPGVTVSEANFDLWAIDAAIKYKGLFIQTEYYFRNLSKFSADGPLPISSIFDHGFYVQSSFFPVSKKLELYGATSWVFGQFMNSHEIQAGANYYPADTRNFRVNLHVIDVYRSPTGSTFGYYVAGQKGITLSLATSVLF